MKAAARIIGETFLPDMIERYPATRAVLDSYGLKGCGGPQGPREQVSWFARLHGVPVENLLQELNEAVQNPASAPIALQPSIADTIYRPFFIAGFTTVLTLGCVWGAINLLTIGLRRNFAGANYSFVLAHAHAMVFGFVGFFIMGFAYQAFPRFKHTTLWRPRLALSTLPLMAGGIILQTAAHLLVPAAFAMALAVDAATIQLVAVIIFAAVITKTAKKSNRPDPFDRFVYAGMIWFLLSAIANPVIFKLIEFSGGRKQLLFNLATFNIPYRDV